MSIGRQLLHMLTPLSFISFDCSIWKRLGSSAYFFCSLCISGCMTAIFAEDWRVFMSENKVSARRNTVLTNMVRKTLPKPLSESEQVMPYIQRMASRNQFVKKKSPANFISSLSYCACLARNMNIVCFYALFVDLNKQNSSGTGSYPPREKGLQRSTRHNASKPPLSAPNLAIASLA